MTIISRLIPISDVEAHARHTIHTWMEEGSIKTNSWGVEILVARQAHGSFDDAHVCTFGETHPEGKHPLEWYIDNAHGKNICCLAAKMDSHEAVAVWPGLLVGVEGIFPWPGGIIDLAYALCIATSGFKADEDLRVSRMIRNYFVMHLDRLGQGGIDHTRARGEDDAEDPSDRFTRSLDPAHSGEYDPPAPATIPPLTGAPGSEGRSKYPL